MGKKYVIQKELLQEMLDYIIDKEERIEMEWGHSRSFEGLIRDNDVDKIYFKIKELLEEV